MPNFEFVISSSASKRPSAALRSHAVKSGLRRKTDSEATKALRDSQLTVQQKASLKGRLRFANAPGKRRGKQDGADMEKSAPVHGAEGPSAGNAGIKAPNKQELEMRNNDDTEYTVAFIPGLALIKSPGRDWADPFNSLPLTHTRDIQNLIKCFVGQYGLKLSNTEIRKECWGFAMIDPLVLHTSLATSAAIWSVLLPNPTNASQEGWRQKSLALQGVQDRLSKSDCSNAVVGAVANLAYIEGLAGDFGAAQMHLQGLLLLIRARGGYGAFRDDIHMGRAINWADLQIAAGLGTRPLFPLIRTLDSVRLSANVLTAAEQPSLSHLRAFERTPDHTAIRFTFSLLRQAHCALKSGELAARDLRTLINAVDYHLANALMATGALKQGHVLIVAAQAFLYISIRQTCARCVIPRLVVRRLRDRLQACLEDFLTSPDHWHGLLWCLCVGAGAAYVNHENWVFFSTKLRKLVDMMNVQRGVELELILRRFLWDDRLLGEFLAGYGHILLSRTAEVES